MDRSEYERQEYERQVVTRSEESQAHLYRAGKKFKDRINALEDIEFNKQKLMKMIATFYTFPPNDRFWSEVETMIINYSYSELQEFSKELCGESINMDWCAYVSTGTKGRNANILYHRLLSANLD